MKHSKSLFVMAAALVAGTAIVACSGVKKPSVPGSDKLSKIPTSVPGNDPLNPGGCGGYATMGDAGRKLHAFLEATQKVEKATTDLANQVKDSCVSIGKDIGMGDDALGGDTKAVCTAVWAQIDKNLNGVAVKSKAALKIKAKPAICTVDAKASLQAAATCEGKATADFKATCSGNCNGTCNGKNTTGKCEGTCEGQCDGYADVNASAQCKANAEINAAIDVKCDPPELTVDWDAKLIVDKKLAESTLKGLKAGLPKIFQVRSKLVPLKHAVENWAKSATDLKSSALGLKDQFKDQAMCIVGQIYAAAKMTAGIQANVSISVEISATASTSVGQ